MPARIALLRSRRALVGLLSAAAIAGACVGPTALASGQRSHQPNTHAAHPTGHDTGPAARDAVAAMQRLVQNGTIDQYQANAVDREINAGSVDPRPLLSSGVVSESQMQAVANAIDQVKRSYGG